MWDKSIISIWLPETSRIVSFQRKYQLLDFADDPEDTSVRRAVKDRLRRGEVIGYGAGVRL